MFYTNVRFETVFRYIFCFFVYYSRLLKLFRFLQERRGIGTIAILFGHRVIKDSEYRSSVNQMYVDSGQALLKSEFIRRLDYLKRNYRLVSLDEAINKTRNGDNCERLVAITFDDGYIDCKTTIVPSVREKNIPISYFISTGFVNNINVAWWDLIYHYLYYCEEKNLIITCLNGIDLKLHNYKNKLRAIRKLEYVISQASEKLKSDVFSELQRKVIQSNVRIEDLYLSWNDIYAMAEDPLFTIGSHTVNHPNLCSMSKGKIMAEINNSKEIIEKKLHMKVKYFAYPHGYFNKSIRDVVAGNGYVASFTVENGRCDDILTFKRMNLSSMPFFVFAVESSGIIDYFKPSKLDIRRRRNRLFYSG